MTEVRVTGVTVMDRDANDNGVRLMAYFDCKVWGLRLCGCSLSMLPNGDLLVRPPTIPGPQGQQRAVQILDPHLRDRMLSAALPVYRTLGGALAPEGATIAVPHRNRRPADAGGAT